MRVQVIMTDAAQEFVRPLTFAALSGEKVITGLFAGGDEQPNLDSAVEHIAVAQSIDALLVAPATADVLAKFAQGIANDFLSTLYLATKGAGDRRSGDEREHVGASRRRAPTWKCCGSAGCTSSSPTAGIWRAA